MRKRIDVSAKAAEMLDRYRESQGGISYSRAIGRLLGEELPTQSETMKRAWADWRAARAERGTE